MRSASYISIPDLFVGYIFLRLLLLIMIMIVFIFVSVVEQLYITYSMIYNKIWIEALISEVISFSLKLE